MAKGTTSKIKTAIVSVLSLVLGLIIGSIANIYISLPDSYGIPAKVQSSGSVSAGQVNVETITNKDLSIHFLELGNKYTGDCTLVKVGDTEMLIDAGSKASSIPTIKQYIDTYCTDGILEYVVVTHAHEDHYAGFATNEETQSLFDIYTVKNIIDFGEGTNKTTANKMYANYIRERDAEVAASAEYHRAIDFINEIGERKQKFELKKDSGVYVEMLYHKYLNKGTEADTENDYSVCLQIVYDDKYYLFTGDLEEDGEESLVENHELPTGKNYQMLHEVEVYKAGHHGSKTSSTDKLMQVIKPDVVCVCCCAGSSEYTSKNENQFPTQEFVNNVYEANPNAKIYVTTFCVDYKANAFQSFNGNIVIGVNLGDESVNVFCSNNSIDLYNTDWFKQNRTLPTSD